MNPDKITFSKLFFQNCVYEGDILNNQPHSRGVAQYHSGNFYYGEWKKGLFDGKGIFIHFSGIVIKGHFIQGKLDGLAEIFPMTGEKILNIWKKGVFYEEKLLNKTMKPSNKTIYENLCLKEAFLSQKSTNQMIFDSYFPDKTYRFFGVWNKSKPNGLGFGISTYFLETGEFHHGVLHGLGRRWFMNGDVISGQFYNNFLQGSCLFYEKNTTNWKLESYENNEKKECLKQGTSDFPPILQFKNTNSIMNEILTEEFIEKPYVKHFLRIYKELEPGSPIKIPVIEVEMSNQKIPVEENFSTIYKKIIDKNNPFVSPKLTKGHFSPVVLRQAMKTGGFCGESKKDYSRAEGSLGKSPRSNDKFLAKKSAGLKTMQNFFSENSKNYFGGSSPSIKSPITIKNKQGFLAGFANYSPSIKINAKKDEAFTLTTKKITANLNKYKRNSLLVENNDNISKNTSFKMINSDTKIISLQSGKKINEIFVLDAKEENKAGSPLNKIVSQLKKEPLKEQGNDIFKEIEGINQIVEAALTEDSNFSRLGFRKKSKSFGLKMMESDSLNEKP